MESQLLAPLTALETSLTALSSSLTTTNTFLNAPAATRDLLSADDTLTSALTRLRQHQDNYAKILHLKAEADRLESQIKDTIRTCVNLRTEICDIHPSILDESDEEEDEANAEASKSKSKYQEIDYDTLLAFAARIGKHNFAAARLAEEESTRRRIEALQKKSGGQSNGDTVSNINTDNNNNNTNGNNITTQESQAALAAINDAVAYQQANISMAFPPPDRLRMGILGQLQLLREQSGEEAVEREIERLVRGSENVREGTVEGGDTDDGEDDGGGGGGIPVPTTTTGVAENRTVVGAGSNKAARPAVPPPAKMKVSLDFDDESDDDDE